MFDDETFARRIAAPLRAPESVDATFQSRVMAVVESDAALAARTASVPIRRNAARGRHWWQRSVTIHMTPIGALAAAAVIAGVVLLGARTLRQPERAVSTRAPHARLASAAQAAGSGAPGVQPVVQHDTTYIVRFVLAAPTASRVALVGDFNNWNRNTTRLIPTGQRGLWTVSVALPPGQHEYAFIVDSTRWTADPHAALTVADDFGTESSIVTVGTRAASPTT